MKTDFNREIGLLLRERDNNVSVIKEIKRFLGEERRKMFDNRKSVSGGRLIRELTALVDAAIQRLYSRTAESAFRGEHSRPHSRSADDSQSKRAPTEDITLIALGGYGRAELNPYSDIDVMLLCDDAPTSARRAEAIASALIPSLWDVGFEVGHSTRKMSECLPLMNENIQIAASVLESRYLAGDRDLFLRFERDAKSEYLRRNWRDFISTKIAEARMRHELQGDSIYLTEPNVKENAGGLRDMNVVTWVEPAIRASGNEGAMAKLARVKDEVRSAAAKAHDFLLAVRTEIHLRHNRRYDVLDMETQTHVASSLGYGDEGEVKAVELFMRDYFMAATNIHHLFKMIANCDPRRPPLRKRALDLVRRHNLNSHVVAIGGKVYFRQNNPISTAGDASKLMRAFLTAQRYRLNLSDEVLKLAHENLSLLNDDFRTNPEVARTFLSILQGVGNVAQILKAMHECRLLGEYMPEFGQLTCLVQYDLYHDYTVDEHTLLALQSIDELAMSDSEEDAFKKSVLAQIDRLDLLRLALLLHDIGKPHGPNHAELGATMAPLAAERLALAEDDGRTLRLLIEKHLLMSNMIQRLDYREGHVLEGFAEEVGAASNLRMLYLMTYADMKAAGRGAWVGWKDVLLREVYEKTAIELADSKPKTLREEPQPNFLDDLLAKLPDELQEAKRHCELMPERYLMEANVDEVLIHLELAAKVRERQAAASVKLTPAFAEIWICTWDRPGLFSRMAGALTGSALDVIGAQAYTRKDGVAFDRFHVVDFRGNVVTDSDFWRNVENDLLAAIEAKTLVSEMIERQQRRVGLRKVLPQPGVTKVRIDNRLSPRYTIIEIVTWDRIGLLYALSNCLSESDLDIHFARISTQANLATDVFYVSDKTSGGKLDDEGRLDSVRLRLIDVGENYALPERLESRL